MLGKDATCEVSLQPPKGGVFGNLTPEVLQISFRSLGLFVVVNFCYTLESGGCVYPPAQVQSQEASVTENATSTDLFQILLGGGSACVKA